MQRSKTGTGGSAPLSSWCNRRREMLHRLDEPLRPTAPFAPGDPVTALELGVHRGTIATLEGDEAEVIGTGGLRVRVPVARLAPDRQSSVSGGSRACR